MADCKCVGGTGNPTRKSVEFDDPQSETPTDQTPNYSGAEPPADLPEDLKKIFEYIGAHQAEYIATLKEAVAIQSVSACPDKRQEVVKMVEWTAERMKQLGIQVDTKDIGKQTLPNGDKIPLPPVIFGILGTDSKKKIVLIYGHLDVQPAAFSDGWDTQPFELTEKDGKLYGRGASDDKGPVLAWLHVIEAYQKLNIDVPVNLKFVLEGTEEIGSIGLDELLISEKNGFLKQADYVCISDNYWLGTTTPCITYGLRGLCYFMVEIECASKDLHSGVYGGTVYEAMSDLFYMMDNLVDVEGNILIPEVDDDVAPVTCSENKLYKDIDFDLDEYKASMGVTKLPHKDDKIRLLMRRWRFPTLSLHGIEGAFSDVGRKTVIPRKVTGKFSIRLVPNQNPKKIIEMVTRFLDKKWKDRGSPNKYRTYTTDEGGMYWLSDPKHPHYSAGVIATKYAYNREPDMTREGGSIPVTLTLQEITGKNVILLPLGAGDDGAHSQNEKIDLRNYIQGTKLLAGDRKSVV